MPRAQSSGLRATRFEARAIASSGRLSTLTTPPWGMPSANSGALSAAGKLIKASPQRPPSEEEAGVGSENPRRVLSAVYDDTQNRLSVSVRIGPQ